MSSNDLGPSKGNIVVAVVLATALIFGIEMLFPRTETSEVSAPKQIVSGEHVAVVSPDASVAEVSVVEAPVVLMDKAEALNNDRIEFHNGKVAGSIRLQGARLDNLVLDKYTVSQTDSNPVTLLAPALTEHAFYTESGWVSSDASIKTPGNKTMWTVVGNSELAPQKDVLLTYEADGVKYNRTISLDENYMFKFKDEIINNSGRDLTMYNYGIVARGEKPDVSVGVSHEGITGYFDEQLEEFSYADLEEDGPKEYKTKEGWFGLADKYWMAMIILPFDKLEHNVKFSYNKIGGRDTFQTDYITDGIVIKNGDSYFVENMVFAGAKEINIIDDYSELYNIKHFDRSIDFGWFYFLTKPFIYILDFFYGLIGNMGWAIILFATILRLIMYPVANKSFKSMARMKEVQPKIKEIQARHKNDKMKANQELMALYQKEKINPMSGCLPLLIQIPVFFSLYKVLYISIELRQAPFIGWITDLALPDPTSVFTLFGLIPITLPAVLNIGVWPLLMGITMFIQQQMNPKPADKTQAQIFMFLPVIFTFMLANFAAGLVIYWTWSNILSIIQQYMIKRSMAKDEKRRA